VLPFISKKLNANHLIKIKILGKELESFPKGFRWRIMLSREAIKPLTEASIIEKKWKV